MQVACIDQSVDYAAFANLRVRTEATDEPRPRISAHANRARVTWQVGDRLDIRELDSRRCEVDEQLGAERLAQLNGSVQQVIRLRVRHERGILHALGSNSDDYPSVLVRAETRSLLENCGIERKLLIAE